MEFSKCRELGHRLFLPPSFSPSLSLLPSIFFLLLFFPLLFSFPSFCFPFSLPSVLFKGKLKTTGQLYLCQHPLAIVAYYPERIDRYPPTPYLIPELIHLTLHSQKPQVPQQMQNMKGTTGKCLFQLHRFHLVYEGREG